MKRFTERFVQFLSNTPGIVLLSDPLKIFLKPYERSLFEVISHKPSNESISGHQMLEREVSILLIRQQPFLPEEFLKSIVECVVSQRNLSVCYNLLFPHTKSQRLSPSIRRIRMETLTHILRNKINEGENKSESDEEVNEEKSDIHPNETIEAYERYLNFLLNSGQMLYLSNSWTMVTKTESPSRRSAEKSRKRKKRRSSNLSSVFNEDEEKILREEFERKEEDLRKERKKLASKNKSPNRKKKRKSSSSVGDRTVTLGKEGELEMNEKDVFEAIQHARKRKKALATYLREILLRDNNNPKTVKQASKMFNEENPSEIPTNVQEMSDVIDHFNERIFIKVLDLGGKKKGERFRFSVEKFHLLTEMIEGSPDNIFNQEDITFQKDLEILEESDEEFEGEEDDEGGFEYDMDGRKVKKKKKKESNLSLEERLSRWKKLQDRLRFGSRSTPDEDEENFKVPRDGKGSIVWWKKKGAKRYLSKPPFQFLRARNHYQSFPYKI